MTPTWPSSIPSPAASSTVFSATPSVLAVEGEEADAAVEVLEFCHHGIVQAVDDLGRQTHGHEVGA